MEQELRFGLVGITEKKPFGPIMSKFLGQFFQVFVGKKKIAHENIKKPASKVAEPAQIQPKSQFLFHKNLPPRDFSQ